MEDREVDSEIGIASDGIIPVFPGAIAQFLLIVLAPDFTIVKITGQRLLEREQVLLRMSSGHGIFEIRRRSSMHRHLVSRSILCAVTTITSISLRPG